METFIQVFSLFPQISAALMGDPPPGKNWIYMGKLFVRAGQNIKKQCRRGPQSF